MSVLLRVVVAGMGVTLFVFTVYAFSVGAAGMLDGARSECCPRCGRHGLVVRGSIHPVGCLHPSGRQRLRHLRDTWSGGVHLGHR